jgi:FSR family fosmidomycin resistance protein-like MFS transporter
VEHDGEILEDQKGLTKKQQLLTRFQSNPVPSCQPLPDPEGFYRNYVKMPILGALPFALILPYANLFWTGVLAVLIAMIMASAFSAILVYAQELLPGRVGLAAGMFYGFSFGLGGLGAAALGWLADVTSIGTVYRVTPFLLLLGLLTAFLPRRPGGPSLAR